MIKINLLPLNLRPVRRSALPYLLAFAFAVIAVLGIGAAFLGQQAQILGKRAELNKQQQELESLKSVVDEYNQLTEQKQKLADKISIIHEIVSERIIWSRQLWNVSRLTPDNFWYSSISEVEKPSKETRLVFNEKTKKEEPKTVTIKRRVLEIGGYVVKGPDGSSDIAPLTFKTEQDTEFSSLFQLNSTKLLDTEFDGFKVRSFTLEYMINTESEPS